MSVYKIDDPIERNTITLGIQSTTVCKVKENPSGGYVVNWHDGCEHTVSLSHLDKYLKKICSNDLRDAIIKELRMAMDNEVVNVLRHAEIIK